MAYFRRFPKAKYDFNRKGVINNIVDIFRQVRPLQNYVDQFSAYRYYEIQDGQRPDIVSKKLYDTPDFYWSFFLVNDFLHDGLSSWPMSMVDMEQYIANEYSGYALETRPNVKYDTDGGIEKFENSLAGTVKDQDQGAFTPGTTVVLSQGGTQTATGTIKRKDIYLNQLVIQDVTGIPVSDGTGNKVENCVGSWTDPVSKAPVSCDAKIWKAWPYAEAPHHYYIMGDARETQSSLINEFFIDEDTVGTTAFTLSSVPYDPQKVTVTVDSEAAHNWSINGRILTFSSAPSEGSNIKITVPSTNPDGTQKYGVEAHVSSANFFSTTDNADLNLILQEGSTAAPLYKSNRQYIFDKNEERSKIRIIDPAFMSSFISKFESLLND